MRSRTRRLHNSRLDVPCPPWHGIACHDISSKNTSLSISPRTHSFIASSWPPTSPIFLFPLPMPESDSSSPGPTSITSHSTLVVPSALMPIPRRVLWIRPSALLEIISSNHDKFPEVPCCSTLVGSSLVDVMGLSVCTSAASSPCVKAPISVSCGRRSRSSSARISSPSRLPTVTCR
jgi:hypothetical protein